MTWRRLSMTTATLLSTVLVVSGCGGGSTSQSAQKPNANSIGTIPTEGANSNTPPGSARHARSKHSRHRSKAQSLAQTTQEALQRLPGSKRAAIVKGVAANVLKVLGFSSSTVTVTPVGDGVTATIPTSDACAAGPGTEGLIVARIRQVASFVRSVQVEVGGTGTSLSAYVGRNCGGLNLPQGNGPVVLTQRAQAGSFSSTTRSFTVRSRRWSIEYLNAGTFLQVFPMRGTLPTPGVFTATRRGTGRHVMTGAGRFRLRITGMGAWIVRVRDGA